MKWNTTLYDTSHDFVSKFGEGLISYLNPQPGEVILDLGCGTGDLTRQIADAGATVIGVDSSEDMIIRAKQKYPDLDLRVKDARDLQLQTAFDAIFSNAVLHWIPETETVVQQMYEHLRKAGRLIIEFGGKGNNDNMIKALRTEFEARGYYKNASANFWYYPSIAEFTSVLERHGFRVILAEHYDRPTPLKGVAGIKDWFYMFGDGFFDDIDEPVKEDILNEVQIKLAETNLIDGVWIADYKRIRVVALKQ